MKPITITLQDEETVRAVMDSLVINLIDTNAMACKYEQACDRLMTEILNSPPQTPLDEKRIIESVSTLRALNDELRRSLDYQKADNLRIQSLYDNEFNKKDKLHNVICSAVDKLSKRHINPAAIADFLMDAIKTEK